MNFEELKNLAKKLGGILVINGHTPEFVVLSFAAYQKLDENKNEKDLRFSGPTNLAGPTEAETGEIERLNKEILALKKEIRQKEEAELVQAEEDKEEISQLSLTEPGLSGEELVDAP